MPVWLSGKSALEPLFLSRLQADPTVDLLGDAFLSGGGPVRRACTPRWKPLPRLPRRHPAANQPFHPIESPSLPYAWLFCPAVQGQAPAGCIRPRLAAPGSHLARSSVHPVLSA